MGANNFRNNFLRFLGSRTQREVADATGISERLLRKYLSGECEPKWKNAKKIADFFQTTVDKLYE